MKISAITTRTRSHGALAKSTSAFLLLALCVSAPHAQPKGSQLTAMSLEQLLDVTIVGASKYEQKQHEVAAAVSVITRDDIKTFGWRTLAEALSSLPGVHTTYDRQYTYLGTRGFGLPGDLNTRVLVMINGNRVNDPVFDQAPAGREFPLDMDLIERIEFIPGPGGAVYGQNAMFGVVNVITRTGASFNGAELALAVQSPQAQREGRVTWGKVLDNGVDVLVSASRMNATGADRFYDFGATGLSGTASGLDSESLGQFYARAQRGSWSLDFLHGSRRKDDPIASFFSDPLVAGQLIRDTYTTVQALYQDSFSDNTLQVSGRLFAGAYRFRTELSYGGAGSTNLGDGDWRGAELRLLTSALAGHKLMAGAELQENTQTSFAVLDPANPANNVFVPKSGFRVGLYVQDEWQLSPTLTATLGLRLDRNDATGLSSSPRAALIWQASPLTTLKALAGRAYRAPNAFERDFNDGFSQVPNLALKRESIDTFELVADHRLNPNFGLRASLYQWAIQDLITLGIDPVSGLTQYQSGAPATARGLELSANHTWPGGRRLRGSMAAQNVTYIDGRALQNSPKLLGKLNYSTPLPFIGLRLGYELQYDSRRLSNDGSSLGDYAVSNLHLSTAALARGLDLSLGIYNLFDKRYAHPAADSNWQNSLDQDGRSVRVKLAYRF